MNKIKIPVGVAGIFKNVEVIDSSGKVRKSTGEFNNLITDTGMSRMVSVNPSAVSSPLDTCNYCRAGTGNATPSFSDRELQNQVASVLYESGTQGLDMDAGYAWSRYVYTFPLGSINNQNIAEISTAWDDSDEGTIFSRALILDSQGNPTTITVLSDEQLRVTWEFRKYWPTTDVVGSLENEGNKGGVYDYTIRAAEVLEWRAGNIGSLSIATRANSNAIYSGPGFYYYPSVIGGIEERPTGPKQSGSSAYSTSGGFIRPGSANFRHRFEANQGVDPNGISCLYWGATSTRPNGAHTSFQIEFTPPILKTSEDILEIDLFIQPTRM